MLRFYSRIVAITIVAVISWGCAESGTFTPTANTTAQGDGDVGHAAGDHEHDHDAGTTLNVSAKYCGTCGEEKGTANCCAADAEKCEACGKNKGSALCCVELDAAAVGKDLCAKCGNVAGAENCCVEGAETCAGCGLAKGSALCCKLSSDE